MHAKKFSRSHFSADPSAPTDSIAQLRSAERFVELIDTREVIDGIIERLREESTFDHRVDNPTEVLSPQDIPMSQHRGCQHAEAFDCVLTQTHGELLTADMVRVRRQETLAARVGVDEDLRDRLLKPATDEFKRRKWVGACGLDHGVPVNLGMF